MNSLFSIPELGDCFIVHPSMAERIRPLALRVALPVVECEWSRKTEIMGFGRAARLVDWINAGHGEAAVEGFARGQRFAMYEAFDAVFQRIAKVEKVVDG